MHTGKALACWPNDCFLIRKRPLRMAPTDDRFWPKVALRRHRKSVRLRDSHEGLESTQIGHSSSLTRTSTIGSQSGRSIGPLS